MQVTLFSVAAALVGSSSAHTIFQELYVNGVSAGHTKGIRVPFYDGPIMDVSSNDLICNGGPNPIHQPTDQTIIPVPAGATVTTEWHHTLDGLVPGDKADPIDPGHLGPVLVYMAKVDSALTTTVTGLKWFKIFEDGLDSSGKWGVDRLYANKGKVDVMIPPCIEDGDYLLRAEIIALHNASVTNGAQIYMECAQIKVSGGGTVAPPGSAIPGIYKADDPGIKVQIYYPKITSYTIPGPAVYTCDGTTSTTGSASNKKTAAKTATKTATKSAKKTVKKSKTSSKFRLARSDDS